MKKPSSKNIQLIKEVMEDSLKTKAFKVESDGPMTSLLFDPDTKIPKIMTELREELEQRGYLMFYSYPLREEEPVLSINISKI